MWQWLFSLRVFSPVLRPLVRLIVGVIAVPLFRVFFKHVFHDRKLDDELVKDLEQWTRGSLLLLLATCNMEETLFGWLPDKLEHSSFWLAMRLLLAVGVIEVMPDQALFAIIHPGPKRLLLPSGRRWGALREQIWPFCKGILCRHLDRSSSVFAILAVIQSGPVGWWCYGIALVQFLIIGLVSSRDKALMVLREFDDHVRLRRQELLEEWASDGYSRNTSN